MGIEVLVSLLGAPELRGHRERPNAQKQRKLVYRESDTNKAAICRDKKKTRGSKYRKSENSSHVKVTATVLFLDASLSVVTQHTSCLGFC